MLVVSVRASTLRFFMVLLLSLALLIGFFGLGGADAIAASVRPGTVTYNGISTAEERIAFLAGFGIEASADSESSEEFTLPGEFDRVLLGYNEIQKSQGLDLSKYGKKKITRYTYEVKNCKESDGIVYANLLVYRDRVIGCDYSTADPAGFVHALSDFQK